MWRQFWNSFDTAMYLQAVSNIQKLSDLMSCLGGGTWLAVRGYGIASQNYDVIRKFLIENLEEASIIKKLLYAELQSIRRNDLD